MLWYKSWLETRWRFVIGLGLLMLSVAGSVFAYPKVMQLMPLVPTVEAGGMLGQRIREAAELSRTYRGYVWSQWFRQNMTQMLTLFAVLLGTGGLLSQSSRGGALFTLSLPATRDRLLAVRAATGLAELLILAAVPPLLLPVISPAVGQTYGVGDALAHGVCMFVAATVFFSVAFFLSTVFSDLWRPALFACGVAVVLALYDPFFPELSRYSLFRLMAGEVYFRGGGLPWLMLLSSTTVSIGLLYAAMRNVARQDF